MSIIFDGDAKVLWCASGGGWTKVACGHALVIELFSKNLSPPPLTTRMIIATRSPGAGASWA